MIVCNINLDRDPCDGRLDTSSTGSVTCQGWKGHDGEHYVEIRWKTNATQLRALLATADRTKGEQE